MFYVTIIENFGRFQCINFETTFLKNENFFQKPGVPFFQLKLLRLKTQHLQIKLPCQKPILRQTERWVQNGPITKNWAFLVTVSFFWKFCFNLRTSYNYIITTYNLLYLVYQRAKCPCSYFSQALGFYLRMRFPSEYP